jgi:RNA polymerase sigma-70 factor (ECF subfamily)
MAAEHLFMTAAVEPMPSRLHACLEQLHHASHAEAQAARDELLVIAAERMAAMARRMLRGFPEVRRWDETDDVVQNAVIRLHRALEVVRPNDAKHFLSLAVLQIRRELIDLARKYASPGSWQRNRETNFQHLADSAAFKIDGAVEHDHANAASLESWTRFHDLASELPEEQREIFDLVWYFNAQQSEIADLLGCSERTVRRRWDAAKQQLITRMRGDFPS